MPINEISIDDLEEKIAFAEHNYNLALSVNATNKGYLLRKLNALVAQRCARKS